MSLGWRVDVSATDRYGSIQMMASLRGIDVGDAIAAEEAAFNESQSLEAYTALVNQEASATSTTSAEPRRPEQTQQEPAGIQIGAYEDCRLAAEGLTSEVYRSASPLSSSSTSLSSPSTSSRALKVIVSSPPPHDPVREARVLRSLSGSDRVVKLVETLRDGAGRLVLVFPFYEAGTLEDLLVARRKGGWKKGSSGGSGFLTGEEARVVFADVAAALADVHARGIIHRDVKPSAILLEPGTRGAVLSDFGTAWDPASASSGAGTGSGGGSGGAGGGETADGKFLDIGSGPYRAPEVLLANAAYDCAVDVWALGVVISAALRGKGTSNSDDQSKGEGETATTTTMTADGNAMFSCPPVHEDGNQLGLLLSIVSTLGTPTPRTWPEAAGFRCSPFDMFRSFAGRDWGEMFAGVDEGWSGLVRGMVRYSGRFTAEEVLERINSFPQQ
ncbi:hypothetical protein N3K66_007716 [Trichothecium roseum]|uniref:Uncharacterized protein n=1 Tax=Trichothecium roseum TaxID=47278 RepID=A0ACC0UUR3_9HYPO|nr:hypothetical protein N3K66_007716 [Trichothecium roseum]